MTPGRSPLYVALFVAGLAGVQLFAFSLQWIRGFRPFGPPPTRVPFSWDMFSTSIERCQVEWTPPLPTPSGSVGSLRDLSPGIEWDIVLDTVDQYRALARNACAFARRPTEARLRCFTMRGTEERDAFRCP